ncbi:MAG: hypothetical protein IJB45_03815 [Clostridia bacterium]|nr:hypothetical protein [Clostridia bacterium]
MKRFLSAALAAIIMLVSLFSVNAFAADTPKADALLDTLETATELSVTLRSGQTMLFGFMPATIKNTIAVKGDTLAYEYSASFLKVKIIVSDDGIYAYSPTLPFFYVKLEENPLKGTDLWTLVKEGANLTQSFIQYIDSYEETVDGVKYYVEEYNDREFVTTKFYFEGETLKMLKVTNSQTNSVQYTYFDDISFDVDDSFFEVPSGAFDLSPILTGLILSILKIA